MKLFQTGTYGNDPRISLEVDPWNFPNDTRGDDQIMAVTQKSLRESFDFGGKESRRRSRVPSARLGQKDSMVDLSTADNDDWKMGRDQS